MIKVAHVVEALGGGLCTYVELVLPRLARLGFDVTLIYSNRRRDPREEAVLRTLRSAGVRVRLLPMPSAINPVGDLIALARLWVILMRSGFDIVHTHASKAGVIGRLAALGAGCPVLHTPHCFSFERHGRGYAPRIFVLLERLLGKLTRRLVAVSRSEANLAAKLDIVTRDRCQWINNGLVASKEEPCDDAERDSLRDRLGIGRDTQLVTIIARLVNYKGVFTFLEAARRSLAPGAMFVIAGEGESFEEAVSFVRRHRLEKRLRLLGHVSDVAGLLRASDLCVICSTAEGQPYAMLEAMRARCAIVATPVRGLESLLVPGQTAHVVEHGAASLAKGIDELLKDRELRRTYAMVAAAKLRQSHRVEVQVSKLAESYRECAAANTLVTERALSPKH